MQASTRKALLDKMLAYDSAGNRVRMGKVVQSEVETTEPTVRPEPELEREPLDPVAEAKTLRAMLTEQQRTLRKAMQSAADSEKAAATAGAQLTELQKELQASAGELVRERLERQRAAASETRIVADLKAESTAAEQAAQRAEQLRERDRRIILTVAPGFALACIVAFFVAIHWSAPVIIPAPRQSVVSLPNKLVPPAEQVLPAAVALDRLNAALDAFPSSSPPDVLREADRILDEAGSPPCSLDTGGGTRAVLVSPEGAKTPLAVALSRCAAAVERLHSLKSGP